MNSLQLAKKNKKNGERLKRQGLAERVLTLVDEFNDNRSYKNAICLAGKLKAIAQACKFDSYWDEKCSSGFHQECLDLEVVQYNGTLPDGKKSWWVT